MILYMMRHGETDWNKKHLFQGRTDIPLNEKGRRVAELTREGLKDIKFDHAFCSPLCRAKETAEIILKGRKVDLTVDERIIEMGFGEYEATSMSNDDEMLQIFFRHPEQYEDTKGVEPFADVLDRANSFLEELIANPKYKDSTILVATHGATLRGLMCAFKKNPIAKFWEGGVHKNCGISIVEVGNGERMVLKEAIVVYDEKDLK